jgi:Amt family ammonium transporter
VILKLIALVMPLRATVSEEGEGLDITAHGEEAYAFGGSMSPATVADAKAPQGVFSPASAKL